MIAKQLDDIAYLETRLFLILPGNQDATDKLKATALHACRLKGKTHTSILESGSSAPCVYLGHRTPVSPLSLLTLQRKHSVFGRSDSLLLL